MILNSVNKILTVGGGIDGAIHEAVGPRLVDERQKLNVTLGRKLRAYKICVSYCKT